MKSRILLVCFICLSLVCTSSSYAQEAEPVVNADSPSGAAGDLSIQFKGTSSVGATDSDGVLNIIEGPITMETWMKMDGFADFWTGLGSWGFSYKMGMDPNAEFIFTFFGVVDIFSGFSFQPWIGDGQWHHVAAVWEPGVGVTFFADGAEVGFAEETGAPREGDADLNLTVGGENNGAVPFIGSMDRFRIHNAIFALEDLDSVADGPKDPLENTIVHYGFDETEPPFESLGSAALPLEFQNEVVVESSAEGWELYQ